MPNFPGKYEEYQDLPSPELAEIMGGREEIASKSNIARLVYEQRQMEQQDKYSKEQIELQHQRNRENIDYQHALNLQVVTKQLRTMKTTAYLAAASTLLAALAGAYLAYTLTQTQKPLQIKLDSEQLAQLQKANHASETGSAKKPDKSPSLSPSK